MVKPCIEPCKSNKYVNSHSLGIEALQNPKGIPLIPFLKTGNQLLFLILLLLSIPIEAQKLSLKECISYALDNSVSMMDAELQNQSLQLQRSGQKRFILPEISAYADYWQYLGNFPVFFFPENEGSVLSGGTNMGRYPVQLGQRANFMTGIQLNQRLFDARLLGMRSSAESLQSVSSLTTRKASETVIYSVTKTYIEIAVLLLDKRLIEANQERVNGIEKVVQELVGSGVAPVSDAEDLQINSNKLILALARIDAGIAQKTRFLKFQMGMSGSEDFETVESATIVIPEGVSENVSTDMQLIEQSMALTDTRLRMDNAASLPTLDLYLNAQWQQQQPAGDIFSQNADWYNLHIAGLRLNIPIFGGKSQGIRKDAAQIEKDKLSLQLEQFSRSSEMLKIKAQEDYQLAKKEVELLGQEVQIRETQAARKLDLYSEGLGSLSDVLDVENALQASRLELNKALLKLEFAKLELLKSFNSLQLLTQ